MIERCKLGNCQVCPIGIIMSEPPKRNTTPTKTAVPTVGPTRSFEFDRHQVMSGIDANNKHTKKYSPKIQETQVGRFTFAAIS